MTNAEIGKRIRQIRDDRGRSLSWVSEQTGISTSTLGRIELGEQEQTVSKLKLIATALECTFLAFLVAKQ